MRCRVKAGNAKDYFQQQLMWYSNKGAFDDPGNQQFGCLMTWE